MKALNLPELIGALKNLFHVERFPIGLHEPYFGGNECAYVQECIQTGWVSSAGKFVDKFEKDLADFIGVKRAVAVVNGTAALHVALMISGVKPQDEIIMPTLTFVATANAIMHSGAVPHFADSELHTLGLDPEKLSDYLREISDRRPDGCYNKLTGRRIKAIMPMHTFGHPVDLDPLLEICDAFGLDLIEDAAESLGSKYKGRYTGNFGKVAAVSFNGNKVVTTGGGGAILTNDEKLADLAKHITTTAKIPHAWEFYHDQVGYNYRMPNINAALGCAQLEQLPDFLKKKRALAERYRLALEGIDGISFFCEPDFASSNYWLNAVLLDDGCKAERDLILAKTNENGILTRPAWIPMHNLPMYKDKPRMDIKTAENIAARLINLPSSVFL